MKQYEFKLKYHIPKKFVFIRTVLLTIEYTYLLYTIPFACGPNPIKWFMQTYKTLKEPSNA